MEALPDLPVVFVVIAAILLGLALAKFLSRRRRESAMRRHASQRGWRSVGESAALGNLVADTFPELHREAEQEARATRRTGGRPRGRPGATVSLTGRRTSTRSRVRSRNVHVVPIDAGEIAAGDVTVIAAAGKVSLGRASVHRGVVAGRLPDELPPLKLFNRAWIDRDGGDGSVPTEFASHFTAEDLDAEARNAYVDSGAWRSLVDASAEVDGVTVDDGTLLIVSRKRLDPERTAALTGAAEEFLSTATRRTDDAGGMPAKVANPLPAADPR